MRKRDEIKFYIIKMYSLVGRYRRIKKNFSQYDTASGVGELPPKGKFFCRTIKSECMAEDGKPENEQTRFTYLMQLLYLTRE